jgi:PAS domain S-box-containing protein
MVTDLPNDPASGVPAGTAAAVLIVNFDLRIRAVSESAAALLGYTREELLTMTVDRIVAFHADWLRAEVQALRTYGTWQGDVPYRHKDGHLIPCVVEATRITTPEGEQIRATIERR